MEFTTHPQSSAEVKERVQLYLYSTSEPSWLVLGRTLPLPLPFTTCAMYNISFAIKASFTQENSSVCCDPLRLPEEKASERDGTYRRRVDGREVKGRSERHLIVRAETIILLERSQASPPRPSENEDARTVTSSA